MAEKDLTEQELLKLLEGVDFLDVVEISEPRVNALRLVVEEMTLNPASRMSSPAPVDGAVPVEHSGCDLRFEVSWDQYDVYQVLNESYDSGNGPTEVWEGSLFRRYSSSRYLCFAEEAFENITHLDRGHQHWAIVGQNHIVHVIAGSTPKIRILGRK